MLRQLTRPMVRVLVGIVLASLLSAYAVNWLDRHFDQPINHNKAIDNLIEIPPGSTTRQVIKEWSVAAVPNPLIAIWLRLNQDLIKIQSGHYRIDASTSIRRLLEKAVEGDVARFSVTLVEGKTWHQWQQQLSQAPWLRTQPSEDGLSLPDPIEGWLMPDTYSYVANQSPESLVLNAHQAMKSFLGTEWPKRETGLPLESPYEVLILASIVEKETGLASERPLIAGVFVNRLHKGMRLQTDPTVIYGLGKRFKGNLTKAHLREKTPYNTYRINGLPPTPIAMPSRDAILAVLHPESTEALYFVAKGDGSHEFSSTLQGHNAAVRRYQLGKP